MTEATKAYKVIGTRPLRPDGADKVTGKAIYGADMRLTGMLYGNVLRSPHAHARIKSIDTRRSHRARSMGSLHVRHSCWPRPGFAMCVIGPTMSSPTA